MIIIKKIKYLTIVFLYLGIFLYFSFIIPTNELYDEIRDESNMSENIQSKYNEVLKKVVPYIVMAKIDYNKHYYVGEVIEDKNNGDSYCIKLDDEYVWFDCMDVTILENKEEILTDLTDLEIEIFVNYSDFILESKYFIFVDIYRNQTYVLENKNDYYYLIKRLNCSTGKNITPTKRGLYKILSKGKSFLGRDKTYKCYYYLQYDGSYLLHSFPYSLDDKVLDDRINQRVSNGCVRYSYYDAKYIYDLIPLDTQIYLN